MTIIPDNIYKLLNGEVVNGECVILETAHFLVVEDIRQQTNSYHYTAWSKHNKKDLLELDNDIYADIIDIKRQLITLNLIQENGLHIIHYPPSFWTLHVHFVSKNHILKRETAQEEIYYIEDLQVNFTLLRLPSAELGSSTTIKNDK